MLWSRHAKTKFPHRLENWPSSLRRIEIRSGLGRGLRAFTRPRHVSGQHKTGEEQQCCEEVWSAWETEARAGRNSQGEGLSKENWTRHAGDRAKGIDGSLQFALRRGVHAPGHQRLHGGSSDAPQCYQRNDGEHHPASAAESESREAESAKQQAGEHAAPLAEPFD